MTEQPKDLHRENAAEIFGVPYEEVTDAQRRYAKVVNYAQHYSMQTPALPQRV